MQRHLSLLIASLLLISLWLPAVPVQAQSTPSATRYGMNMEEPNYWNSMDPFIDYLQQASSWSPGGWPPGTNVPAYGPDGYPLSGIAGILDEPIGYIAGAYQFYGEGLCDIWMDGPGLPGGISINPYRNSSVIINGHNYGGFVPGSVTVTQENGIWVTRGLVQMNFSQTPVYYTYGGSSTGPSFELFVQNIDPNNTPHNFHLIRPDYHPWPATQNDAGYPFGKEFLQALAPFCSIRFGWDCLNDNITYWSTRTSPIIFGQSNLSIETMIAMCNVSGCDMWYQIPFNATADFDTNFATLVKNNLNPNLHCRYEISDELWNYFGVFGVNTNIIASMWANSTPPPGLPPYYTPSSRGYEGYGEVIGSVLMKNAVNIQPILGSQGIPMLCGQFVNTAYEHGGLKYIKQQMGIDPASYGIEISGAPYFGVTNGSLTDNSSVDDIFQGMTDYLNGVIGPDLTLQMNLAHQYGVKFDCYEWAQNLGASDQTTWNLCEAAQTDPRMGTMYQLAAQQLQNAGANLVNCTGLVNLDTNGGFFDLMQSMLELPNPPIKYATAAALAAACNCGNAPAAPASSQSASGPNAGSGGGGSAPSPPPSAPTGSPSNSPGNGSWTSQPSNWHGIHVGEQRAGGG